MYHEVTGTLTRALSVAEAFRAFADEAIATGKLARPMASTLHRSADETARRMRGALEHPTLTSIPADLSKCLKDSIVDLETLGELALLAVSHDLTPRNALHLAHGLRYTANKTVETLLSASRLFNSAWG